MTPTTTGDRNPVTAAIELDIPNKIPAKAGAISIWFTSQPLYCAPVRLTPRAKSVTAAPGFVQSIYPRIINMIAGTTVPENKNHNSWIIKDYFFFIFFFVYHFKTNVMSTHFLTIPTNIPISSQNVSFKEKKKQQQNNHLWIINFSHPGKLLYKSDCTLHSTITCKNVQISVD